MASLSARIRSKMKENNLSAHALEKQAGLRPSAVHNILYGRSKNPSVNIIQAIAHVLNCTTSELLEEYTSSSLSVEKKTAEVFSSESTQRIPWNNELYLTCLETVTRIMRVKKAFFPKEKILDYVDEIYLYSSRSGKKVSDKCFAEWLIEKNLDEKNI